MRRRRLVCCVAGLVVGLTAGRALCHDLRPGVLSLVETGAETYDLRFVAPIDSRGDVIEAAVELPDNCRRDGARVHCAGGLTGAVVVRGMRGDAMATIVQLERRDGSRREWIIDAGAPAVTVGAAAPPTWPAWIRIGVDHILGGPDHLAFVVGLLLVLGLRLDRRLLLALTAFTAGHSLTLALAVLGVVRVSIAPVEACIAASVLLVAREAISSAPTAVRRWPWLAALGFGLIHGLGFASALGALGLAGDSLATTLVCFNLGVELGQLAVVAAVLLLAALGRVLLAPAAGRHLHRAACYGLGAVAAWWLAERVVALAA